MCYRFLIGLVISLSSFSFIYSPPERSFTNKVSVQRVIDTSGIVGDAYNPILINDEVFECRAGRYSCEGSSPELEWLLVGSK